MARLEDALTYDTVLGGGADIVSAADGVQIIGTRNIDTSLYKGIVISAEVQAGSYTATNKMNVLVRMHDEPATGNALPGDPVPKNALGDGDEADGDGILIAANTTLADDLIRTVEYHGTGRYITLAVDSSGGSATGRVGFSVMGVGKSVVGG